ncbi:hypothetical protein JAAARDRAFT_130271, partial [Jaapia argillacea MUCL 33604]
IKTPFTAEQVAKAAEYIFNPECFDADNSEGESDVRNESDSSRYSSDSDSDNDNDEYGRDLSRQRRVQ